MKYLLNRYKRLIIFSVCSCVVFVLFYLYQDDYYKWSCEEESNSASCFLYGKKLLKDGHKDFARNYFQLSCSKGYQLGCSFLK